MDLVEFRVSPVWRSDTDTKFCPTAVHPDAGALRRLPLHGRGFPQRYPGKMSTTCCLKQLVSTRVVITRDDLSPAFCSVLGPDQALHDALQAPAGLLLPPPRPPEEGPPLHVGPDHLPGCSLDPQIHLHGHHLPCHGLWKNELVTSSQTYIRKSPCGPETLLQALTSCPCGAPFRSSA